MSSSSLVISLVHGGILLEDVGSIHLLRQIKRVFQQLNPPALRKLLQEKSEVTKNFRYLKWRTPEPYKAILGMRIPLHKPYPYSLYRWVPPFSVPEIFGDEMASENLVIWNSGMQFVCSWAAISGCFLIRNLTCSFQVSGVKPPPN